MITLGIETSCDETAAAVVASGPRVLSNVVYSQIRDHVPFGGVVPEIAARRHLELLPGVLKRALADANIGWADIDRIAVTTEPGLAGALLIGLTAAQSLALALRRPLVSVHHIEAHLYSIFLSPEANPERDLFPLAALVVSGGHTSLMEARGPTQFRLRGRTLDDAAGECLDKGAKLMGLPYPGGPEIERMAATGNPDRFRFPRGTVSGPLPDGLAPEFCFSFSGIKTSLRYFLRDHPREAREARADIAAGFQEAVFAALAEKLSALADRINAKSVACAGGVARNRTLRARLERDARRSGRAYLAALPDYCTDNAAMIAAAAEAGLGRAAADPLEADIHPQFLTIRD